MARRRPCISILTALALLTGAPAAAQDKSTPSRPIDQVTGMLLYCMPVAADPWTKDLCAAIDKEAIARAKANDIRFVALTTQDNDTTNKQKARAAGFDPANAEWVLVKVQRLIRAEKGWSISVQADGIALQQPGAHGLKRRIIYTQGAILGATISRAEAAKAGRTLVEGLFQYFTRPAKPATR
jgi:hypothetical protein